MCLQVIADMGDQGVRNIARGHAMKGKDDQLSSILSVLYIFTAKLDEIKWSCKCICARPDVHVTC
jgi:hypothetical protein